jgi:hypothetical protein
MAGERKRDSKASVSDAVPFRPKKVNQILLIQNYQCGNWWTPSQQEGLTCEFRAREAASNASNTGLSEKSFVPKLTSSGSRQPGFWNRL